jgi:hypothetical protein
MTFETKHVKPKKGRTLVVGSYINGPHRDYRKDFKEAIGVDILEGPGVDVVHNLERPFPSNIGIFKHVVCHSVFEHVSRPWLAAENIQNVMDDGATIYLSVPWAWRFHSYPSDYWRISHEALKVLFPLVEWRSYSYDVGGKHKLNEIQNVGLTRGGVKYVARTMLHAFGSIRKLSES